MTALPPLYAIADADACAAAGWTLTDFAAACLDGGARLLQVRAKHAASGRFLADTQSIVQRAKAWDRVQVVVNDRADIARLAGADGVHVGQDDLEPCHVRRIVGRAATIGWSTHTTEQLDAAILQATDTAVALTYVAIGPVFSTHTKNTGYEAIGLERVRDAARQLAAHRLPLVAIGGITLATAESVLRAGATSVAVIGDLLTTGDPAARVREYLDHLKAMI